MNAEVKHQIQSSDASIAAAVNAKVAEYAGACATPRWLVDLLDDAAKRDAQIELRD